MPASQIIKFSFPIEDISAITDRIEHAGDRCHGASGGQRPAPRIAPVFYHRIPGSVNDGHDVARCAQAFAGWPCASGKGRGDVGRLHPPDPLDAPFEPTPKHAGLCGVALRIREGVGNAGRLHPRFS